MKDKSPETRTSKEKRIDKISQLKAQIQKEQAKLKEESRKERNGQLIAFGIWVENFLKSNPDKIDEMRDSAKKLLADRNLERFLSGIKRIAEEIELPKKSTEQKIQAQEPH